jgi:hydroxylamine oxidation protein HaoB
VLAWWDTSRQLRHFGAGEVSFGSHFGLPLFVPEPWRELRSKVSDAEAAFWKTSRDAAQELEFREFVGALVSDESEGVKTLRKLAQGRKAVLVLHVRDILLLGQMEPKKAGVSFRDFADPGDVHRSVRGVQDWLREDSSAAYTVLKLPNNMLRAVALTDEATGNTLAARLLPFVGNRQEDVVGLTLVYRAGGFSVFELDAVVER